MQKIWDLQSQFKEDICNILVDRYKELHDGLLPKWEDEDVVLTENEIDDMWLNSVVTYEIVPLLNEYWFDEPSKVRDWEYALREAIR